MLSCEEGVISRSIYLYKINNRSGENELSKFDGLDCHGLVERAKQSGYESVPDKRHQILQGMVKKFNDIQDLKIGSWSFPEILKFEGVSLWQFVTERCYDAYPREIIEIIEYVTELIEKFNPEKLRVLGKLKNPQRAVLELIAEHYKKEISFFDISISANSVNQETDNKLHFVDPAYEKLETGDRFAVRDYIASIQNCVLPSQLSDKVLLVSYPRVWTKNINKVEIDQYYEFFKTFFEEKEWQPIRVDVPYYFTIQGSKKSYIDSCKMGEKGGFSTIFFDELYDDEIAQVGEKYRTVFEQKFDYFSRTAEFQAAFSWKGISFFRPLFDFWIYLFVDYLARQCVTSILISRKIIVSLKPKAIFAIYEVGVYARAMIIEAHRANIPSVGLQHGAIHSDSLYYMHKNVSNHPPLDDGFFGFVVATKTLIYGDYHKKVLTTAGYYPEDSVFVLGCDWRLLNVKQECLDKNRLYTLKRKWFSNSKKIALILTGAYNTAIIYRLIERLDPSKYSILVKLHPSDKNEHFYYNTFTENNFEVRVIRDYLYESIEIADLIFTPSCSTVVMDCLALNKPVFCLKEFDLGGTQPWEHFTINMLEVDDYDEVNIPEEDKVKIHNFLRDIGYGRSMSIKSLNAKLHQVFDELEDRYFPQNICREDSSDTENAEILNADYHRIAESVRIAEEAKKLLGLGGTTSTIPTLKKAIKFTPNYAPAHNNPWAATFRAREFGQAVGSGEQTYSLGSTNFDYEARRLADAPGAKTNPKDKNKNNSIYPVENYERGNITNKSSNENSVSVVVPAYNRQKTIERAIVSALQQNYPVHEIIVVDDCSTDNTVQIVEEFACRDSRVKLICHNTNKGAQAARNTGIRNATGEWIAFLDSDDEWLPTRLQAGFDLQEREGFKVIHSQCYITEGNDNNPRNMGIPSLSGNIYKELLKRPFPMFQGLLVKRECLERIGYLDEAITSFQEWDTSIRLARHYEFGFVSEPLFIYHRCHSEDTISNDKYKDAEGYYQIVEKHADEIIKYAGTEALMNHYMITLEKLKALTAYEKFQQVKVKLKALIDSEKKELTINGGVKEVPNRMY